MAREPLKLPVKLNGNGCPGSSWPCLQVLRCSTQPVLQGQHKGPEKLLEQHEFFCPLALQLNQGDEEQPKIVSEDRVKYANWISNTSIYYSWNQNIADDFFLEVNSSTLCCLNIDPTAPGICGLITWKELQDLQSLDAVGIVLKVGFFRRSSKKFLVKLADTKQPLQFESLLILTSRL